MYLSHDARAAGAAQLDLLDYIEKPKRKTRPASERLAEKLKKQPDGCHVFTGAIDPGTMGYGRIRGDDGKIWRAHRLAYFLEHGHVPPLLRHTCHTFACCNTAHLIEGTCADNTADMIAANRQRGKLKAEQVQLIVKLHFERGHAEQQLAKRFNVSCLAIRKLLSGRTWSKVTGIKYEPRKPHSRKHEQKEAA